MSVAVSACIMAGFVFPVLDMVAAYEERQCFIRKSQAVCLAGIMLLNIWLLQAAGCCTAPNLCSYAFLLVTAVIDEQTGGIYDCFGWFLIAAGALAVLSGGHVPAGGEMVLIYLYLGVIVAEAAFHGMGAGDVPVYLALLLYYIRYAGNPGKAAVFMLLMSHLLFGFSAVMRRRKKLPFVPYLCMAHLFTVCLWCRQA